MNEHELNLPEDVYAPVAYDDVHIGDICEAVGLPDPSDANLYETKDLPHRLLLTARVAYALVVSTYQEYTVVVPITTADVASNHEQFEAMVAAGGTARWWMRMPILASAWPQDAVAMLFMPQTLASDSVVDKRLVSMHPEGRSVIARRFARALTGDDS